MNKLKNSEGKKIAFSIIILSILALCLISLLIHYGIFFGPNNLRYNNMPIKYSIESGDGQNARTCLNPQLERIDDAVRIIENETSGKVSFMKVNPGQGDIFFYCAEYKGGNLTYSFNSTKKVVGFTLTEGESQYERRGNVITRARITFYEHENCGIWPDIEIHEILHVLGYSHLDDESSIMNPLSVKCDIGKIDDHIIKGLIETY